MSSILLYHLQMRFQVHYLFVLLPLQHLYLYLPFLELSFMLMVAICA